MNRIYKNQMMLLTPGTKLLRIVRCWCASKSWRASKSEMTVTKGPYKKFIKAFQSEWYFIKVIERYSSEFRRAEEREYFISDLFNGEVYILDGDDIIRKNEEFIRNAIMDSKEYITDKDLEVLI